MASSTELADRGMQLVYAQLACLIAAIFFTAARACSRVLVSKRLSWEDWTMFGACAFYTAYGAIVIHGVLAGDTGKPVAHTTVSGAMISLRAWYLCELLYPIISSLMRTSICGLLLHIASTRRTRQMIVGNMGLGLFAVPYFFVVLFQCSPPDHFWLQLDKTHMGSCLGPNVIPDYTIAYSILSALSDLVSGTMPILILWKVRIDGRTKVLLCMLLGMSAAAGAALLLRIPYFKRLMLSAEFLYETVDFAIFSIIEPAIGIVAGSVCTLRPLVVWFRVAAGARTGVGSSGNTGFSAPPRSAMQAVAGTKVSGGGRMEGWQWSGNRESANGESANEEYAMAGRRSGGIRVETRIVVDGWDPGAGKA